MNFLKMQSVTYIVIMCTIFRFQGTILLQLLSTEDCLLRSSHKIAQLPPSSSYFHLFISLSSCQKLARDVFIPASSAAPITCPNYLELNKHFVQLATISVQKAKEG